MTPNQEITVADFWRAFEVGLSALRQALRTLDPSQGPRGRRNARLRVSRTLKAIQAAVDTHYPAPARKAPKVIVRRTVLERRKLLIAQGYVIVTGDALAAMAEARIAVVRTPKHEFTGPLPDVVMKHGPGEVMIPHNRGNAYIRPAVWAPGWAVHYYTLGKRGSSLLQISKNVVMIRAAQAAIRLGSLAQAMNGDIRCPGI